VELGQEPEALADQGLADALALVRGGDGERAEDLDVQETKRGVEEGGGEHDAAQDPAGVGGLGDEGEGGLGSEVVDEAGDHKAVVVFAEGVQVDVAYGVVVGGLLAA
jgi:hypothetical protein